MPLLYSVPVPAPCTNRAAQYPAAGTLPCLASRTCEKKSSSPRGAQGKGAAGDIAGARDGGAREPSESERRRAGTIERSPGTARERRERSAVRGTVRPVEGVWVCGCGSAARRFGRVWEGYVHRTQVPPPCGRAWAVTGPLAAPTQCTALRMGGAACVSGRVLYRYATVCTAWLLQMGTTSASSPCALPSASCLPHRLFPSPFPVPFCLFPGRLGPPKTRPRFSPRPRRQPLCHWHNRRCGWHRWRAYIAVQRAVL